TSSGKRAADGASVQRVEEETWVVQERANLRIKWPNGDASRHILRRFFGATRQHSFNSRVTPFALSLPCAIGEAKKKTGTPPEKRAFQEYRGTACFGRGLESRIRRSSS